MENTEKREMKRQKSDASLWEHETIYMLDWETLGKCLEKIAKQMLQDAFYPVTIVGISRGGLVPATYFANMLDITDFHVLGIARNMSNDRYSKQQEPELLWMTSEVNLADRPVLLIDDIAGEGKTMALAVKLLQERGASYIRTAVIVSESKTIFQLDYSAVTLDGWTVFPWEKAITDADKRVVPVEI